MYGRITAFSVMVTMAIALRDDLAPSFTLDATGAVTLQAVGSDARFGLVPVEANGHPLISLSLGATSGPGSVLLYVADDRMPPKGRYPIVSDWQGGGTADNTFRASFVAGAPAHAVGWFHAESGWVTITEARQGFVSGEFEIRARGFMRDNPEDENRWVTVRGRFRAEGDRAITTVARVW